MTDERDPLRTAPAAGESTEEYLRSDAYRRRPLAEQRSILDNLKASARSAADRAAAATLPDLLRTVTDRVQLAAWLHGPAQALDNATRSSMYAQLSRAVKEREQAAARAAR